MSRKLIGALFAASLGLFLAPQTVLAQADPVDTVAKSVMGEEENHLDQAKEHLRSAIGAATDGKTADFSEHAVSALGHATAAQRATPQGHLKAGIAQLNKAITHGKKGHLKIAKKHAEIALNHFEHAK